MKIASDSFGALASFHFTWNRGESVAGQFDKNINLIVAIFFTLLTLIQ